MKPRSTTNNYAAAASILRRSMLAAVLFFALLAAAAQERITLTGIVASANSGERINGALVRTQSTPYGAVTNSQGFFSMNLPKGVYTISVIAVGYSEKTLELSLNNSIQLNIDLQEKNDSLEAVTVTARKGRNLSSPEMGVERLNSQAIKNIPVLLGERDVMKAIQLLPGVKSAGDGNSGFYVRGGGADQNLVLMDGAPVYNASHLLGFFSTFNSDVVKDLTLYKGGMPAQFGGRLSSVLDIRMNEGNNDRISAGGGIGLISSRLYADGPLKKNKSSFLVAGRRTYADMFLKLSNDSSINRNRLYFYDLNMKLNYKLGKKDQLFLSGYLGQDHMSMEKKFGIDWGNNTATLRWQHVYGPKLQSNTSLIYSNYNYEVTVKAEYDDYRILSRLQDWSVKQDYQLKLNSSNNLMFGVHSIYHQIKPGEVKAAKTSGVGDTKLQQRYAWENVAYISNNWKATPGLSFTYGLRVTAFSVLGPGKFYSVDGDGRVTDTAEYKSGAFVKNYVNAEPRLMASYRLSAAASVKASYTRNVQNLHLVSNSTSSSPTDKWVASSNIIRPEIADQYAIGYYQDLAKGRYELTVEAYYKDMYRQIDYRNDANVYTNDAIESQLLFGKGRAYGLEWLLRKREGKLTGWVSYTWSKTERKIDGINNNNWYRARQDRTHDLAIVGMLKLNNRWTLSANWVYYTGDAVTFPAGKYLVDGRVVYYYTERNAHRMPDYHRLDLGATYEFKKRGRYTSELTFSLYNAYGRENAYSISFRESETSPGRSEAVQTTLFKYIPSITYNFKF